MDGYLQKEIKFIPGVGEARAKALRRLGVETVGDMLGLVPRKMEDRSRFFKIAELAGGQTACVRAVVTSGVVTRKMRQSFLVSTVTLRDDSGIMQGVWYNNRFIKNAFEVGKTYDFYGRVEVKFGKKELITPLYEPAGENAQTGALVPVYPLTASLTQKVMAKIMKNCLAGLAGNLPEVLPEDLRSFYHLPGAMFSYENIHFPKTIDDFAKARRRMIFEEFLLLQLGLRTLGTRRQTLSTRPFANPDASGFIKNLPFSLTGAQKRVVGEICADVAKPVPMNRLVQGDVGSGKTAVAACGLYVAVQNGFQGALLAPTEILATQHFKGLAPLFESVGMRVGLLCGSMKKSEKMLALENIKNKNVDIVIGTHALLEENVEFNRLGFVVTDEQHRFGVRQRARLAEKGENPHVLVMSATPIPRTLALILYGDLDVSVIDELPPGRQNIDTFVVDDALRQRAYGFVKKQIEAGRQAYVVCPLVEESENMDLKAVTVFAKTLADKVFAGIPTAFLHGKMKGAEKEEIMGRFAAGEIKVLVSTTVIEVGVNVPNATVMVVEDAQRFGLSALHQLRGRVGRGSEKSYCILFCNAGGETTKKRMDILEQTNDGFAIAQKDLEIRGPGEFFGTRQHGLPALRFGNLFTDMEILQQAGGAAAHILKTDPNLKNAKYQNLKQALVQMFTALGEGQIFN